MLRLPNFLIVGAQKSGTTWLHAQLKRHPDVFMSETKELNYFNQPGCADPERLEAYKQNFDCAADIRLVGESTPHYFWRKTKRSAFSPEPSKHDTANSVSEVLGQDVTILVILRDPVSRAVSSYHHNYSMGRNPSRESIFRLDRSFGVIDLGFYRRHWNHWEKLFGRERMKVMLYDDLVSDPPGFLRSALDLLELSEPPGLVDDEELAKKINSKEAVFKRNAVGDDKKFPLVYAQEIGALASVYRGDIDFVRKLTGRALESWDSLEYLLESNATAI